ncbi:response regulator transcription factor [Desulfitibacter alkalitolerans]|uniref:response regulator transcription factor n=1 Tax=Desulfitibacter alkalitolerans TaxID=264641 RepID=UPI0004853B9D|nr:response regulator transcription factor [Desulfitibacter alkalitolerans]
MARNILVVEDEQKLNKLISDYLAQEGYNVTSVFTGKDARRVLENQEVHLIILDWMLPDESGLDICREVRSDQGTPIIMLTAKSDEFDKVMGLEMGADDYMTKPFSLRELAARVKVVLRRYANHSTENSTEDEIIRHGDILVDLNKHSVYIDGNQVKLTPTEFKLLAHLIQKPGRVYSRLQLLETLGEAYEGYERSLDTHMSNLRKKIEKNPNKPKYIITVYGIGYKMEENADENPKD